MALATVDPRRSAERPHGAAQGRRRGGLRLLHQHRIRTRAASFSATPKAALVLHWKSLRRQIRARGPVVARERRGGRRLFPEPPPRQPHRRLGEPAVAPAREPLRAREGGRRPRREIRDRRGAAPALLDGLPHRARVASSSGRTARSACTTGCCSPARATAGGRPGSIPDRRAAVRDSAAGGFPWREAIGSAPSSMDFTMSSSPIQLPPRHAADRGEPRHRPCDRQAVLGRGLAGDHLLAPRLSGKLPLGDGTGGPPPGRPRRCGRHAARHRRGQGPPRERGRPSARARQQCRHLAEGRGRVAARGDRYRLSRIGCMSSRSTSSPRSCSRAASSTN